MKRKLLFASFLFLIGITIQAKNSLVDPPTATMTGNATICPGNTAVITIIGSPNSIVTITSNGAPSNNFVGISASGTATFTTPILNQTTLYMLVSVRDFFTQETTTITNVTVLINVVPNGCAVVNTNGNVSPNDVAICTAGECRTLTSTPTQIPSTATYEVSSIPYCPQAEFSAPWYNQVDVTGDDIWSNTINLPFSFCFFNQNFSTCQVGTNGLISFNPQVAPGFCDWKMNSNNLPNIGSIHKNAIFGVLQDSETITEGGLAPADVSVNWTLTGTYPCRKLIVNFYHLGQFQCNQSVGPQTSQIVLYEVSNIIEVYVQNRTRCADWEHGEGVIGIINNTGTTAYVPPGRNVNDAWTTTNEAWRFTPNGPNVPVVFQWLADGNQIATGPTVTVCPAATTTYVAQAIYNVCGSTLTVSSPGVTILVATDATQDPADLSVCNDESGTYAVDLTQNDSIILGSLSPFDYEISYFTTLLDAQLYTNAIANPANYTFTQNETIYAGIENVNYACVSQKPFQLTILGPVEAPSGTSPQDFTAGQTLGDLEVTGQNLNWYDAPEGGNLLPENTVLQDDTTYYASQTVNDCESRMSQTSRLAIHVQLNLNTGEFDRNAFSFYPNPTTGSVTITSTMDNVTMDIFNVLSQKIEHRQLTIGTNTVDMTALSSGVYLFQLNAQGKTKTFKIVKN